jgi:2-hydroxy-3-oxopropionate reductase
MVPDTPDVEAVLFGDDGVVEGFGGGKIVVDMSAISPIATKDFAKRVESFGASYIDAPVSGRGGGREGSHAVDNVRRFPRDF